MRKRVQKLALLLLCIFLAAGTATEHLAAEESNLSETNKVPETNKTSETESEVTITVGEKSFSIDPAAALP